jgi:hypothetical protein
MSGPDFPFPVWALAGSAAASSPISLGPAGSEATLHLTRCWVSDALLAELPAGATVVG